LRPGFRVGRDEQSDLALTDRASSRQHAQFAQDGTGYLVQDLGSTHGTFVNGQRVEQHLLGDGDQIQVGNVVLAYHEQEPPQAADGGETTMFDAPATPALGADSRRLRLLYEVSRAIGSLDQPDELLGRMLEAI